MALSFEMLATSLMKVKRFHSSKFFGIFNLGQPTHPYSAAAPEAIALEAEDVALELELEAALSDSSGVDGLNQKMIDAAEKLLEKLRAEREMRVAAAARDIPGLDAVRRRRLNTSG